MNLLILQRCSSLTKTGKVLVSVIVALLFGVQWQQQSLTSYMACEAAFYTTSAGCSGVNGCGHLPSAVFGICMIEEA